MTSADHDEVEQGSHCDALLAAAHPELYRRNAFRVSGVPVEATQRDIARQVEKLQLMQKYGTGGAARSPLAITPPPDEHAVRAAVHDLNDPERRLIDEFFWFWPTQLGQTRSDPALALLANGDVGGATAAWREAENGSEACVSTHNLAVLHHCLALDLETEAASRPLTPEERSQREAHWEATSRRWRALLGHEAFWSRLTSRIRALEDPRLTTGLARRIRQTLPQALLTVSAALAVRTAEAGDFSSAKHHLDVMSRLEAADPVHGGTPAARLGPAATLALKQALRPLRKRITSVCEDFEARADADPSQGDRITRELVEHTRPLLKAFDALLGPADATRDAVRDEVALAGLRCQIPYGNKTMKWRTCLQLLELISPIAATDATRARLNENLEVVRGNVQGASCWFCADQDAVPSSAAQIAMYGEVTREWGFTGTKVRWRSLTVQVPRCQRCEEAHKRSSSPKGIGVLIGAVAGIGGCAVFDMGGGGFLLTLVFGAVGWAIGAAVGSARLPPEVKPYSHGSEFPKIKMLTAMGWAFGEKPANVR